MVDIAVLVPDHDVRGRLMESLRALGCAGSPCDSLSALGGRRPGALVLGFGVNDDPQACCRQAREACGGPTRILAVAPDSMAGLLLAGGANDLIPGDCPAELLAARLGMPGAINPKNPERELAWLAAIVGASEDAILGSDAEGRIISWNRAAERLYGYSEREALGRTVRELLVPDDLVEEWQNLSAGMLTTRNPLNVETVRRRKDGARIDVAISVFPIQGVSGEMLGVACVARDITERKRSEEALRSAEEFLRNILANAPVITVALDKQGVYTFSGGAGMEALGLVPGAAVGHSIFERFPDMPEVLDAMRQGLSGEDVALEWEYRGRMLSTNVSPLRDGAGEVTGVIGVSLDTTERRRAQEALRESEEKFRAFAETTTAALWAYRGNDIFYANKAFLEMTGYSLEEVTAPGFFLSRAAHPDFRQMLDERRMARLREEDVPNWVEFKIVTKTGEERWVGSSGGSFALSGEAAAVLTAFDITDRKRAEEALQSAERFLRSAITNAPVIMATVDVEGIITFTGGAALEPLGLEPGSWVGDSLFDHFGPESHVARNVRLALAGDTGSQELALRGRLYSARFAPLREHSGEIAGAIGIAIDITDQKHAEEERRKTRAYLRTVLRAAPVILWAIDTEGRFTLMEGAADGEGGRDQPNVGTSLFESAESERAVQNARRALAGGSFSDVLERGDRTWETHYSPLRQRDGSIAGVIGVSIDITERRRAEQAMLQAQKLESLGVLAGGIAHDFNNLLVGILGNAGIALMELPANSPARDTIEEIEKAGQRAADLARQMLAYSGKGKLVTERVELNGLVAEMTHLMRVSLAKAVSITYDLAPELPAIQADPTQMRQVVMNLVVNASDAIGPGPGTIAVRTGVSEETPESLATAHLAPELAGGTYAYLEVADTGCGIEETTLARIFDPFFTTKFTGRGLGLAAVLGIIRSHRGAIRIQSGPGAGTTFRILVPALGPEPAVQKPGERASDQWEGTGTIVVADDEESVRAVTARALGLIGFDVRQAEGGEAAVALVRADEDIVCVLLDMTMPGMGGEETFAEIHAMRPGLPIVIMSGYSEQEAVSRFPGDKPSGFVQKPYELGTLREVVRRAIEGGSP